MDLICIIVSALVLLIVCSSRQVRNNLNLFSSHNLLTQTTGYVACCLLFNTVAVTFMDRVRRNWLISLGFFCVMSCLIAETVLQKNYIGTTDKGGLAAAVVVIYLFAISFPLFLDGP